MSIAGMPVRKIAAHFDVSHSTIVRAVNSYNDENEYKSRPRTRPRITSTRTDRRISREAQLGYDARRQPLAELQQNVAPEVSRSTISRRLSKHNIKKWQAAERPLLEAKHKEARLEWALRYRHYTTEDWQVVVWSDEMSVCKSDGKVSTWVFRTPVRIRTQTVAYRARARAGV